MLVTYGYRCVLLIQFSNLWVIDLFYCVCLFKNYHMVHAQKAHCCNWSNGVRQLFGYCNLFCLHNLPPNLNRLNVKALHIVIPNIQSFVTFSSHFQIVIEIFSNLSYVSIFAFFCKKYCSQQETSYFWPYIQSGVYKNKETYLTFCELNI